MIVRSDGEVVWTRLYSGENAVGNVLNSIQQEEVAIRKILAIPKSIVMTAEHWGKHKNAEKCNIVTKV